MKLSLSEFNQRVLPLLRAQSKGGEALKKAVTDYLGADGLVVDDEDRRVSIEVLVEPESTSNVNITAAVEKAVGDALAKAVKDRGPSFSPSFSTKAMAVPATARRWSGRLKSFKGEDAEYKAYGFGLLCLHVGSEGKNIQAKTWLEKEGMIGQKAMGETSNIVGGAFVPDEFTADLIRLVEEYGVFRANARNYPMMRDTAIAPRRTAGLTAYAMAEHGTITTSDVATDNIMLVARKWATLTRVSNELNEDSAIAIGDLLATEIALAFANKEDDCGFNGDGTSTYHGINGIRVKISDGTHTASISTFAANTNISQWSINEGHALIGLLPRYAQAGAKWYCHNTVYAGWMQRVMAALGGTTWQQGADGVGSFQFLGFPVVISQIWPSVSAINKNMVGFGDLSLSSTFGDRKSIEVATSEHRYFEQDQLAIRGIERMDINNHDLGDNTNAGPFVIGRTAAS